MNFGMLNGPSDGAVLMGLMTTALGVIGPEFFTGKLAGDWEIREVLYTVIVVFSIAISVLNVLNV